MADLSGEVLRLHVAESVKQVLVPLLEVHHASLLQALKSETRPTADATQGAAPVGQEPGRHNSGWRVGSRARKEGARGVRELVDVMADDFLSEVFEEERRSQDRRPHSPTSFSNLLPDPHGVAEQSPDLIGIREACRPTRRTDSRGPTARCRTASASTEAASNGPYKNEFDAEEGSVEAGNSVELGCIAIADEEHGIVLDYGTEATESSSAACAGIAAQPRLLSVDAQQQRPEKPPFPQPQAPPRPPWPALPQEPPAPAPQQQQPPSLPHHLADSDMGPAPRESVDTVGTFTNLEDAGEGPEADGDDRSASPEAGSPGATRSRFFHSPDTRQRSGSASPTRRHWYNRNRTVETELSIEASKASKASTRVTWLSVTSSNPDSRHLRIDQEEERLNDMAAQHTRSESGESCKPGVATLTQRQEKHLRSPFWLRVFGVLPWAFEGACLRRAACAYTAAITLVLALAVAACGVRYGMATRAEGDTLQFGRLCDLALASGSLLAQRTLFCCKLLGHSRSLLVVYARRQGILADWWRSSRRLSWLLALFWLSGVVLRGVGVGFWHRDSSWCDATDVVVFAFASAAFTGLTYSILHMACAITLIIDAYCVECAECAESGMAERAYEWNLLQSMLRMFSRAVGKSFLILQTTTLAMLLMGASDVVFTGGMSWWAISTVVLALGALLTFFKAADVTELCTRVPSYINSLNYDNRTGSGRHYLVQYVMYSAAGFYVGEVRLSGAMALKLVYTVGLVAFGILTKVAADDI